MSFQKRHLQFFRLQKILLVLFIWQLWTTPTVVAQELTIPVEIKNALTGNARALEPITIEWQLQRHSSRTIGNLIKKLGSKRYDFYHPETGTVILDKDSFYLYEKVDRNPPPPEEHKDEFIQQKFICSFDGDCYFHIEDDARKSYSISTLNEVQPNKATNEVMKRVGFQIQIGEPLQSAILSHLESGGKLLSISEEEIGDSRCVVLKMVPEPWTYSYWKDREYKYYLDVQKNYAVSQIDWVLPNGRLLCRIKNSDWQKLEQPEIWLPRFSSCEWHTWHYCPDKSFEEVFFYEDITCTELSRKKWPHSKFSPDLEEPGLYVSDPRPEAKSKPGARWNESTKKWDYTTAPDFQDLQPRGYSLLFIVLNIVVIVLLAGVIFQKYRLARK